MNVLIDESTLTGIANAIREALSNEDKMKMSEVATKIEEIVAARDSFKEQYNYYWKESNDGKYTIRNAIVDNGGDSIRISTATTFEMLADKISTVASTNYNQGVEDTKVGTAIAEDVLAGKTFTNANGVGLVGTLEVSSEYEEILKKLIDRSITEIVFPDGITSIGSYSFYGCKLTKVVIPETVTNIGSEAFSNCNSLTEVTFKSNPSSIASVWFANCYSLKTINVPWAENAIPNAPWGAPNATVIYNYTE